MVLSKQDVLDWKNDPVTQEFFSQLQDDKDRIADEMVLGAFTGETVDQTAQLIAREIGKAQALQSIVDFAVENLLEYAVGDDEDEN